MIYKFLCLNRTKPFHLLLDNPACPCYACLAFANSEASRDKLKKLQANSTPFNRAFFVRDLRTPNENAFGVFPSMVGRKGQRLGVGCFPVMAVCHPFTPYRPTVTSQAVMPATSITGAAK